MEQNILHSRLDHLGFLQTLNYHHHHFPCLICHLIQVKTNFPSIYFILYVLAQFPPPPFNTQSPFFPPPPPLSAANNSSGFIPSPFLPPPPPATFPLPPPDLLSKMMQTPPPPLPVPAPVHNSPPRTATNTNINNEDLYDPLKAEEDDEEETELKTSPVVKPTTNKLVNIKKEYPIKIEPSNTFFKKTMNTFLIDFLFSSIDIIFI
jgi:hypothetical protein